MGKITDVADQSDLSAKNDCYLVMVVIRQAGAIIPIRHD